MGPPKDLHETPRGVARAWVPVAETDQSQRACCRGAALQRRRNGDAVSVASRMVSESLGPARVGRLRRLGLAPVEPGVVDDEPAPTAA